ncbi:MAG: translational machinery protein [Alphaproteobacteria bacterium]|nr:translational machinery protein [Alphaproteobacteria bacterium]
MRSHYHAVIWIDHLEARIFQFGRDDVDRLVLHPDSPTRHLHHRAHTVGSGHAAEDQDFLHQVIEAVAGAGAVLITGPSNAKIELLKHIHHHDPRLIGIVAGVETVDHPSDAALVAYAKRYFKTADHMKPQIP